MSQSAHEAGVQELKGACGPSLASSCDVSCLRCRLPPKEDKAQQMAEAMVRDKRMLSDLLQKGGAKIAGGAQPAAGGLIRGICRVD